MINWDLAWRRQVAGSNPFVQGKKQCDFRPIVYNQSFATIAIGQSSGILLQTFPGGAFVLGIAASARFPRIVKKDQYYADGAAAPLDSTFDRQPSCTPGNRDMFSLNFQYTNDENITPGGPALAEALLGSGGNTQFPHREIVIDPSQGILCQCRNDVTLVDIAGTALANAVFSLTVNVEYFCMVPRLAG